MSCADKGLFLLSRGHIGAGQVKRALTVQKRLAEQSLEIVVITPDGFSVFQVTEWPRWKSLIVTFPAAESSSRRHCFLELSCTLVRELHRCPICSRGDRAQHAGFRPMGFGRLDSVLHRSQRTLARKAQHPASCVAISRAGQFRHADLRLVLYFGWVSVFPGARVWA